MVDHEEEEHVASGLPLTLFNDEEMAFKETVQRMAKEKIEPLVRKMDANSHMEQSVIDALFENGVSIHHLITVNIFSLDIFFSS